MSPSLPSSTGRKTLNDLQDSWKFCISLVPWIVFLENEIWLTESIAQCRRWWMWYRASWATASTGQLVSRSWGDRLLPSLFLKLHSGRNDYFHFVSCVCCCYHCYLKCTEKAMAPHSSTLAWKIPWTEEPERLQSMGSLRVGHNWATSLSLFTFMHWRRKWQPTPVFLPGESQRLGSLVGCRLWGHTESDTTEAT